MLEKIIIATCIMAEAEGEGVRGRELVADTICNRAQLSNMSPVDVVETPKHYATLKPAQLEKRIERAPEVWNHCLHLATRIVRGTYKPTTQHTHFYAHNKCGPVWAEYLVGVQVYKNHTFGKIA